MTSRTNNIMEIDGFNHLNKFQKLFLKITNRKKYKQYKRELNDYNFDKHFIRDFEKFVPTYEKIKSQLTDQPFYTFKHSGNAGDIIYSLPAMRSLSKDNPSNFLLQIDTPAIYTNNTHPLGNVRLNASMAKALIPLLNFQSYISEASIFSGQPIEIDLDDFRSSPLFLDRGNIIRWYFYLYGINYDLSQPWLSAPKISGLDNKIVIARSQRYRNPLINYAFLKKYTPHILFVGVEAEYKDIVQIIPGIQYQKTNDFLELSSLINSSKFFIGNQSFPFSIAEGLKVKRILEICPVCPNVIPEGSNGYDAYFQAQFEFLVDKLFNS
jgi:hypothetical protein